VLVGGVAALGAVASYAAMALRYDPEVDPSRLYYGTDTRSGAILLGAGLAATGSWWHHRRGRRFPGVAGRSADRRLAVLGQGAAVVAGAVLLGLWVRLDGRVPLVYRGGLALSGLAAAVLIATAATSRRGPVVRVLNTRALGHLGIISYGLYLWHWPVFVALDGERDRLGFGEPLLLAVKLAASLALAEASYRVIERPIRTGGLSAWGARARPAMPAAGLAAVILVLLATVPGAGGPPPPTAADASLQSDLPVAADPADPSPPVGAPGTTPGTAPAPAPEAAPAGPRVGALVPPRGRRPRVLVVGDSVANDVALALQADGTLGLQVGNRALVGCSVGRRSGEWRDADGRVAKEPAVCRTWEKIWRDAVDVFRPDAVVLLFGGPPGGTVRSGKGVALHLDSGWHPPCDTEFARYWGEEVAAGVQVLASRGATVFVGAPTHVVAPMKDEGINAMVDCTASIYRDAAGAAGDHVHWLPIDTWVCPPGQACIERVGDVRLREDGLHFWNGGRRLMGRWVAGQLFTPVS
jgi:lysophospholipase L1-like esterase